MPKTILLDDEVLEEDKITQEVIDNLCMPYFHLISDKAIVDYIYYYCKKLLDYSMNKHASQEVAYAINLNSLEFEGAVMGNSHTVDITQLVEKIDESNFIFMVLHNHPSNNPFSPKDLETFVAAQNMAILMVLGNKGAVYIIEKLEDIIAEKDKYEIRKALIDYRTAKISFNDIVDIFDTYGIKYTCIWKGGILWISR